MKSLPLFQELQRNLKNNQSQILHVVELKEIKSGAHIIFTPLTIPLCIYIVIPHFWLRQQLFEIWIRLVLSAN